MVMAQVQSRAPDARVWDTADVPAGEAFDYYHGAVCQAFSYLVPVSQRRESFCARVENRDAGCGFINTVRSTSHLVTRSEADIARGNADWMYLNLYLGGGCVIGQDGGLVSTRPGDIALFSGARPFTLEHRHTPDFSVVSFMAPGALLSQSLSSSAPHKPVLVSGHSIFGSLIKETAGTLARQAARMTPEARERLFNSLFAFTGLALDAAPSPGATAPRSQALYEALRAFIDRNCVDAEFDIGRLAAANGVSARYAHKLFSRYGDGKTISDYLIERRLDRAAQRLRQGCPRSTVTDVAFSSGFSDLSLFYRAFRRRYGSSPGAFRKEESA
jgi:AraC-like DNA-binding protein